MATLPVSPRLYIASSTLTRPSDTAPYASGDAIASSTSAPVAPTIQVAHHANAPVAIKSALLIDSNSAGAQPLVVWLLSAAYTPTNDNAAFGLTDAEALTVEAVLPFSASYAQATANNKVWYYPIINSHNPVLKPVAGTKYLYWALMVNGALTPISAETFTLKLAVEQL